ncbi:MAG: hypothetical protein MR470_00950 [Prevotella sp.]|nr:hypothetical protein [Prevotella sp.]
MKKKNYITPNLIIVSIATDSLVLAGSGGGPQSVTTVWEMATSLVNTAASLMMTIMIWNGTGNGCFYLRIIGYLSH